MSPLIFRPFRASDAKAVSRLFRQVYGDHYARPDVYLPKLITQRNHDGCWHSMLAVKGSRVLGHAALYRDRHPAGSGELALSVVHPSTRGQSIATRLNSELLERSRAVGDQCVLIKQVTHHPYTQCMAKTLGFHCTGLLPDHVPSPLAESWTETLVIGVHPLDGHDYPIPEIAWPDSCRAFVQHLGSVFGSAKSQAVCPSRPVQMQQHYQRVDVIIERLDKGLLDQLTRLPRHWLISARLALSPGFAEDFQRLSAKAFVFSGLTPASDQGRWFALFHRGAKARHLDLHCPHMQRLHDDQQHAMRNSPGADRSAA